MLQRVRVGLEAESAEATGDPLLGSVPVGVLPKVVSGPPTIKISAMTLA